MRSLPYSPGFTDFIIFFIRLACSLAAGRGVLTAAAAMAQHGFARERQQV